MALRHLSSVFATAALAVWLCCFLLYFHYDATRPVLQRPAEGRVYPWNNHGHVVYLSRKEELTLYLLGAGAGGLFLIAVGLRRFSKAEGQRLEN